MTQENKIKRIAKFIDLEELVKNRATLYDEMGGYDYIDLFTEQKHDRFVLQIAINGHVECEKEYLGNGTDKELRAAIVDILTISAEGRPSDYIEDIYNFVVPKGQLLGHGTNMFRMMDFCCKAEPKLTEENSIAEFNVATDEWWLYKKLTNKHEKGTAE